VTAPEAEGGDSACWAHLVCAECGALEGHRTDCAAQERANEDENDHDPSG